LREFRVRNFVSPTFGRDEFRRHYDEKRLSTGDYVKLTRRDQPSLAPPGGITAPDVPLLDYDDLTAAATANLDNRKGKAGAMLDELTADLLVANFVRGGHIHQNAAALVDLGLAIVKLDGMYRGVFDASDVRKICALLEPEDGAALSALLLARPWGEHVTRGWRKAAFLLGLH
ncbi:MAG TPA: hypothetical protein VFN28_16185, partial [Amaricoccus sp.]|nr:hypothetical protein [Amaricoccus sp.]